MELKKIQDLVHEDLENISDNDLLILAKSDSDIEPKKITVGDVRKLFLTSTPFIPKEVGWITVDYKNGISMNFGGVVSEITKIGTGRYTVRFESALNFDTHHFISHVSVASPPTDSGGYLSFQNTSIDSSFSSTIIRTGDDNSPNDWPFRLSIMQVKQ